MFARAALTRQMTSICYATQVRSRLLFFLLEFADESVLIGSPVVLNAQLNSSSDGVIFKEGY